MLNKCLSGKRGYWLGFVASFGLVALALLALVGLFVVDMRICELLRAGLRKIRCLQTKGFYGIFQ